jgi:predicted transglutaminase-like cysteine proteinase
MGKAKQMYSQVKKTLFRTNAAVVISLFCATAAQANVYETPRTKPEVLAGATTPAPLAHPRTVTQSGVTNLAWLTPAHLSTTLHLTRNGLPPLAAPAAFPALAATSPVNELADSPAIGPVNDLANSPATARDRIVTASIPAAAAPAGAVLSQAVRQDLPLFGAHRIRFGKIKSGVRISGLIRKASTSGPSAICINQCADLADRLALNGSDITAQLRHVSASVNKLVAYRTDEQNHGRLDYWSTPNETLSRSSGDCEDYAILKMALLSRLGVPVNAMEIVVVKDTSRRLFHAVLSVALEGESVILDNMTDAVETDTAKRSYAPLFSISGNANYVFGYKGGKQNLVASLSDIAAIAPGAGF